MLKERKRMAVWINWKLREQTNCDRRILRIVKISTFLLVANNPIAFGLIASVIKLSFCLLHRPQLLQGLKSLWKPWNNIGKTHLMRKIQLHEIVVDFIFEDRLKIIYSLSCAILLIKINSFHFFKYYRSSVAWYQKLSSSSIAYEAV